MATEDEAREAADGTEVQVEAVDLGTVHLQAHPDVKVSSIIEIKKVGEIIDSTERTLKVPEDQVLVEESSEVELPPEHKLNGKDSSLNGHMDKEKISNHQPLENNQEEAELDGTSAHRSNGIHKEQVTDSLSHGESITEDSGLLKHEKDEEPQGDGQKDLEGVTVDDDSVQEDTLNTESAIEQTDDGQQDQNQEPEKANEDTQPASIANNADIEVVAEAPTGPQTPAEPHLDDSGEVPGSIDEKPEPAEPVKEDCAVHLDHNASLPSLPEDTSIAETTEEVVKVEDQQSQKDDMMEADVVQEEILTCEETDVQEEVPKSEYADEPATHAHEVLNQESTKETDGPVDEKIEDTAHQSNMEVPEETATREPPVNIQVQNQESLEEIEDVEAVNLETEIQQRSIAFEEVIPEDQHGLGITVDGGIVQEDTLETIEKTEDVQQDQDVGLEKATENTQHESMANIPEVEVVAEAPSSVQTSADMDLDNSDGNIETDESAIADGNSHPDHKESFSKDTSIAEPIEEVAKVEDHQNQQADAMDEDVVKKEVLKSEQPDELATDTQELLNQESTEETDGPVNENIEETEHKSNIAPPEETMPANIQMQNEESLEEIEDAEVEDDSTSDETHNNNFPQTLEKDSVEVKETISTTEDTVEDNVTAEEPTCDSQQVDNAESTKETKGSIAESIVEVSDVVMVDNAVKEQNVLPTEHAAETHMPESEPEETKNTEPVKTEEPSNQTNAVLLNDSAQGDNTLESETQQAESATETTETETAPQEINACVSEEPDHMIESETNCDSQEVSITESLEAINGDKDIITGGISGQNNMVSARESAQENNVPESKPTADIQSLQELEPEAIKDTGLIEVKETSGEMYNTVFHTLTEEDNPATIELHESARELTNREAADEGNPHQSSDVQSEEQPTEEIASEPQVLEPESVKEMNDTETTEPQNISQDNIISTSGESVPEDIATEGNSTTEPEVDHKTLQDQESGNEKEIEDDKPQEISSSSALSTSEQSTSNDNATATEQNIQAENSEPAEGTEGTEYVRSDTALAEVAAPEENVETDATADMSPVQEPERQETKDAEPAGTEDIMTSDDLPAEKMDMKTMETEVIPHESHVTSTNELTEDGTERVMELEPVEDTQDTSTTEEEPVGEIKGNDENEAEEEFHTSQIDVIEKPASEDNIESIEATYDIKKENELEGETEINSVEVINDGEQTENATSENPSPTENETAKEGHPAELNEKTMGIEADNAMMVPGTKDEIHTSSELQGYVSPSKEHSAEDDSTADEPHNNDFPQTLKDSVEVKETISTTEDTVEDNVTAEEPTCDSQEVDNAESTEETKGSIAENIVEVSDVVIIDNTVKEQNVLPTEDAAETHMPDPEPEETKNTEPVETEEPSNQKNAVLSNDSVEGDNTPESEMQQTESATETTETETALQESDACVSEEPDHMTESETNCDSQEVSTIESLEAIDGDKDIITGGVSGQNNIVSDRESAEENNVPESQSEEQATEEIASEPQELEPESVKEMNDTETTETQNISQDNIISTSGESVPEDIATEGNSTTEPEVDHKTLQDQESGNEKEIEDDKPQEISSSSALSTSEQSTSNDNATATEQNIQAENSEPAEGTEGTEYVRSDTALAEVEAPEENVETDATADMSPVQEPERQETKDAEPAGTEDIMTSDDLPAEKMDMETMETEVIPHESHVTSTNELTEDGTERVMELEPVEDTQDTSTMEQEPVGEIKGNDENEAEEEFHTSQIDVIEKPASEDNIESIVATYDIKKENELEGETEINSVEVINDGEQTENATSEDPSPKENETAQEGHPAELNEQTMGIETDNAMLVPATKDEIQTSLELKDDTCDFGETVLTTQEIENVTVEDAAQSPVDDILETKKGDIVEGGEQTSDLNSQHGDVAFQLHTCEADALSIEKQDEVVQKVDLDQQQKDEKIESQKEELQTDEQKYENKGDYCTTEPIVESEAIENDPTYRTEDSNPCEAEQTETVSKHEEALHASEESALISTDTKVENIKSIDEGTEDSSEAKNDNKDVHESTEKDDIVAKDSTDEQDETTGEITNEELEPDLASSGQEASDPAPSNDDILHSDPASIIQTVESGENREDKECTDKVNDDVHTIQASAEEITDEIEENKELKNEENVIHHDELEAKPEEEEAPHLPSNEPCTVDAKTDDKATLGEEIVSDNASINPREIEEIGESKGLDSTSETLVESSVQNNIEQDLNSHHMVDGEKLSMTEQNAVDIEAMQEKVDASASDINQTRQHQEEINIDDALQLKVEENSFGKIDETISHVKTETSTIDAVTINDNNTDEGNGADDGPSDGSLQTFKNTGRDLDVSSVIIESKEESVNENMGDPELALPAQGENTLEHLPCLKKTEREMLSSEKLLPTEPEDNQIPNTSNEEESKDENQILNEKNEEHMQDTDIGDAQKEAAQDLPVSHFLMNLILGKKSSDANENSESETERKKEETTEDDSCMIISKQEQNLGSLPTENKVDDNLTFEPENHDVKCAEETKETVNEESDNVKLDTERSIQTDEELNKNTRDLEIAAYHGNPQDNISGEQLSEEAASVSTKMETRDIEIPKFWLFDGVVDTVCQESTEASTKVENGSLKSSINDLTNTKASREDTLGEGQIGLLHESLPGDKSADAVLEQTPLLTESGTTDAKVLSCDAESVQNLAGAKEDEPNESSIIEATGTPDTQLVCEEVENKEEEQHASMATGQVSEEDVEGSNDNIQKSTSSEVKIDEQAPQTTEPVSNTEKILAQEEEISEACMEEKENSNFSIKGVENFQTVKAQLVCEEAENKEEEQHASMATGQVSEDVEGSNDNVQKGTSSEVKTDEQAPQTTEPVSNTEKILAQEEEISEACMEKRDNSNFSIKGVKNFQTAVEIQADGPNMKINQDKKDDIADNKTAMEPETDTEQKSPEVTDGDQQLLVKETMIKEQVVPVTVENQEQTMSIKSNEEQEVFDSKVQERDLNMISPREASDAEENFVDVKPDFSTDEEQSPRNDAEEINYDEKTKEVEETKNYSDGAAMKTEAPGATQKTPKKLNLLSGVGSKVKHQLAKVKKAIVGKPGKTKPDSPKA